MHVGFKVFYVFASATFKILHILAKFFCGLVKLLLHWLLVAVSEIIFIIQLIIIIIRDYAVFFKRNLLVLLLNFKRMHLYPAIDPCFAPG